MSFTRTADSWKAKLHLSDRHPALLAGVCLVALIVLVVIGLSVSSMLSYAPTTLVSASELVDGDEASGDGAGESSSESADASTSTASIFVHVTGAVVSPGLYEIPEGERVNAAIEAAGGFSESANTTAINLAREAVDGEQIYVPELGEDESSSTSTSSSSTTNTTNNSIINGKVNINTADVDTLDTLPGIGTATAENIIADREANGPFTSIEDIKRVSGIGDKKYEQIAELICIG